MLLTTAQWLPRRLAVLFGMRRAQSSLGALALPPEIILMVAAHLTNPSIISLALTCRTLYRLCFPCCPHLDAAEKEELFLLLEKDVAALYFCHYCIKLHPWHTRWDGSLSPVTVGGLPCKGHLGSNFLFILHTCDIAYHHARLVMNRHFYGPTHGLPFRQLENRIRMHDPSRNVWESESLHARIVDDKLLLLSVQTMFHLRGDPKTLRDYVDLLGPSACKHLTLHRGSSRYAPAQLPELAKDKNAPSYFAPCHQSFRSCSFCLTDYSIDISWRSRRRGYVIKVFVYRQLGDCRSPFDWSWRSMATRQTVNEPRTAYPLEYGLGMVRDRWNKADGIDCRTQGEWVNYLDWLH